MSEDRRWIRVNYEEALERIRAWTDWPALHKYVAIDMIQVWPSRISSAAKDLGISKGPMTQADAERVLRRICKVSEEQACDGKCRGAKAQRPWKYCPWCGKKLSNRVTS